MPYITDISGGNNYNTDIQVLTGNMARNIEYFRQQKDRRVAAMNAMQAELGARGLADKVKISIDEDNRMSTGLTDSYKDNQGMIGASTPNLESSIANNLLYDTSGADYSKKGRGAVQTMEDRSHEASDMITKQRQNMMNATDTTAYDNTVKLQNVALTEGVNRLREVDGKLNGQNSTASNVASNLATATEQAKDAAKAASETTVDQANALGHGAATTQTPSATTTGTAPATGSKDKVSIGAGAKEGVKEKQQLKLSGEYDAGTTEMSVPKSVTREIYDPIVRDEEKTDPNKLLFVSSLASSIDKLGGGSGEGGFAQNMRLMYQNRVNNIAAYQQELQKASDKTKIDYEKIKIEAPKAKATAQIGSDVSQNTTIDVKGSTMTANQGNSADNPNNTLSELHLSKSNLQGNYDANGHYKVNGGQLHGDDWTAGKLALGHNVKETSIKNADGTTTYILKSKFGTMTGTRQTDDSYSDIQVDMTRGAAGAWSKGNIGQAKIGSKATSALDLNQQRNTLKQQEQSIDEKSMANQKAKYEHEIDQYHDQSFVSLPTDLKIKLQKEAGGSIEQAKTNWDAMRGK